MYFIVFAKRTLIILQTHKVLNLFETNGTSLTGAEVTDKAVDR